MIAILAWAVIVLCWVFVPAALFANRRGWF
jgi:hypothetical protein